MFSAVSARTARSLLNNSVYTYIQVMNGCCYILGELSDNTEPLPYKRGGIRGYVSKGGEEVATFDDAAMFSNSKYTPVYRDGSFFLIDKQMNRVSEDIGFQYANSPGHFQQERSKLPCDLRCPREQCI
ncbi:MAG: hypothetical protein ACI4JY_01900 [Oscillospiraceae bacterium]